MVLDAAVAYVNDAAFTPGIVIEEPEGRTSGSSTTSQSVEPQRWSKLKTTPTDISAISKIESEENNDTLRQAALRDLTQLDVETDLSPNAIADLIEMHKETAGIHARIRQRIELLKEIGEEEEIAYNANSEHDLWHFLKRLSFIKNPRLFLLDNGNLRAVWKGDGGKHIGLQFLGGGQIQFVIFSKRGEHNMARIRGRDDFAGIARQLDASAIGDVIYA